MVQRLTEKKVIGIKQTLKAIKSGGCKTVYVAKNADDKLVEPVLKLANEASISVVYIDSMKELGKICGIEVGAAAVAALKD